MKTDNFYKVFIIAFLALEFVIFQLYLGEFFFNESFVVGCFLLIFFLSKKFVPSLKYIFSIKNIFFIVFFMKLYVMPSLAIFYGYLGPVNSMTFHDTEIFNGYLLTLLSYISFVIGWEIMYLRKFKHKSLQTRFKFTLKRRTIKKISFILFTIGILSLILYYGDFQTYILSIYGQENINKNDNSILKIISSFAKFFLPIAIFGFYSLYNTKITNKFGKFLYFIFILVLLLICTLNPNRQNMLYPIAALIFAIYAGRRVNFLFVAVGTFIVFYGLFNFSKLRSSDKGKDVEIMDTKELVTNIQVYISGAHMITPIFQDNEMKNTILPSILSSFPILGQDFRGDNNGVMYYNYLIYGNKYVNDQVYPSVAETFKSGGIILTILFFSLSGYFAAKLNIIYVSHVNADLFFRCCLIYLIFLFNSTILLSFQVMGQFVFYNSVAAVYVIYLYRKEKYTI